MIQKLSCFFILTQRCILATVWPPHSPVTPLLLLCSHENMCQIWSALNVSDYAGVSIFLKEDKCSCFVHQPRPTD